MKGHGRKICNALKAIRKKIANDNNIEYNPKECTHTGECQGTCPACEQEVSYLENELLKLKMANKTIILAGAAALTLSSMTSCNTRPFQVVGKTPADTNMRLMGEVAVDTIEEIELEGDVAMPLSEEDSSTVEQSCKSEGKKEE